MPDLNHWSIFFGATIILLLIPGPSVIYVVTRGVEVGYQGAVLSSMGLALGDLLQVICTVIGLSALLNSSVVLFASLKYAGAAYLVLLGARRLVEKKALLPANSGAERCATRYALILQGFFALNPKTALFFLAFFPQFLAQNAGPAWVQMLLFGCVFVALGFITNSVYGCLGGKLVSVAGRSNRFQTAARYVSGVTLIGIGLAAAFAPALHRAPHCLTAV